MLVMNAFVECLAEYRRNGFYDSTLPRAVSTKESHGVTQWFPESFQLTQLTEIVVYARSHTLQIIGGSDTHLSDMPLIEASFSQRINNQFSHFRRESFQNMIDCCFILSGYARLRFPTIGIFAFLIIQRLLQKAHQTISFRRESPNALFCDERVGSNNIFIYVNTCTMVCKAIVHIYLQAR